MNTIDLVGKGYFPEGLIPPFNTKMLGDNAIDLFNHFENLDNDIKRKYYESQCVPFSVPKTGLTRRMFEIPNPIFQIQLSKIIEDNWSDILLIYESSSCSNSYPIPDDSDVRAIKPKHTFKEIQDKNIEDSFNKSFLLQADISKFFASIYTHSITWAMHSKEYAKAHRGD